MNRLAAVASTLILLLASVMADEQDMPSLASQYIHALAPMMFPLKQASTGLQQEAFRTSDLLVVYGSSELEIADPYHASTVFAAYPTGFTIFPVGGGLTTSLVILQDVAAVGDALRGRKVVISVSPPFFFLHDRPPDYYAPNYSHLHLSSLLFSPDLSVETRQAAALELENSPGMVEQDPLIAFAVARLAERTATGQAFYAMALPVGMLENAALRAQDAADTDQFIQQRTGLASDRSRQPSEPSAIDWQALIQQAADEQQAYADNNPFGFDNQVWTDKYSRLVPRREAIYSDAWFVDNLNNNAEFTDLDVLLRGLSELGAQPLVISQPIPGKYYEFTGISQAARIEYYKRLRAVGSAYGVPVVDFQNHDEDLYFVSDPNSHLSREGWAYYDQALDAFYHDAMNRLDPAEWNSDQF